MLSIFKPLRTNPNNPFDYVATKGKRKERETQYKGFISYRGYTRGLHRDGKG